MLVSTCVFVITISYTSYIAIEVIYTMSLYIIATVKNSISLEFERLYFVSDHV